MDQVAEWGSLWVIYSPVFDVDPGPLSLCDETSFRNEYIAKSRSHVIGC